MTLGEFKELLAYYDEDDLITDVLEDLKERRREFMGDFEDLPVWEV